MCREPGSVRRQKKNCLSVSSLLMIPFTDCFFNSVRHCNVFSFPTRPRNKRIFGQATEAGGVQTFLLLRTPFCALLWRWALKNVGTCFLQAPRSKKLSIRYVFHGAGAPHRNSDAQKAHCFQQAVTPEVAGRLQFQPAPPQIVMYPQK